ncbi:MAG TPA: hypothetical protein VEU33_28930 [Archangium sp.]|nr:hypothetical protein [Archangium sp.]
MLTVLGVFALVLLALWFAALLAPAPVREQRRRPLRRWHLSPWLPAERWRGESRGWVR